MGSAKNGAPSKAYPEQLYPSVAVSDLFCCAMHGAAAFVIWKAEAASPAWLGNLCVAAACFFGVLRFGFSASSFSAANESLATNAAFVGIPLVGLSFYQKWGVLSFTGFEYLTLAVAGSVVSSLARALSNDAKELLTILFNVGLFIVPALGYGWSAKDYHTIAATLIFAFAGVVVTPDRHRYILGVRRENWFHYLIGIASYGMALGLTSK